MLPPRSSCYLPVTEAVADAFVEQGLTPALPIEWASVWALLAVLGRDRISHAELLRYVSELHALFAMETAVSAEARLGQLRQRCTIEDWTASKRRLLDQGIVFAPEDCMAEQAWRDAEGRFSGDFQQRCSEWLQDYEIDLRPLAQADASDADLADGLDDGPEVPEASGQSPWRRVMHGPGDQARVVRAIMATPDEHFSMAAYAGTGKTHLLLALAEAGGRYTHLAPTAAHRQALIQRLGTAGTIHSITLYDLANTMAAGLVRAQDTRWQSPPRVGQSTWSVARQAEYLGIPAIGEATPASTLLLLFRLIRHWCFSQDPAIELVHARRVSPLASAEDLAACVAWATKVWEAMLAPRSARQERVFSLNLFHLVKWLDVAGAGIPPMGTLLLDEAHDLPGPWYALLRRYPQGWVTMGDPYQCLSGSVPHAPHAKALVMAQSVRAGEQVTPIMQQVLERHSEVLVHDLIRGSREHVTRPCRYGEGDALPDEGLRAYGRIWTLLEDALWLNSRQGRFRLIKASETELVQMVKDAMLLRRHGDLPKSYKLRAFRNWPMLAQHLETLGHGRVLRMFDRGFDDRHLASLIASQRPADDGALTMGLLEHCKNMEFDIVTLSDCCVSASRKVLSRDERDEQVKALYVAMSRARRQLWFPGDTMERLTDQG